MVPAVGEDFFFFFCRHGGGARVPAPPPPGSATASLPPLGLSDHVQILASIPSRHFQNTRSTMLAHTKTVWCWSKANNAALKEAIKDANWDEFYEATSVNIAWQRWKSILLPLAENHIPQRTSSSTIPPKPWITAEIRAQIRGKHRLYRRYKKKRCPEAWDKYRQVRNAVASHLKKAKSLFVLNRLAALRHTRTTCREIQIDKRSQIANVHGYKLCCEVCSSKSQ